MKLKTFEIIETCSECHGDGDEGSEGYPCGNCGGLGHFSQIKRYKNIENAIKANPFYSVYEYDKKKAAIRFTVNDHIHTSQFNSYSIEDALHCLGLYVDITGNGDLVVYAWFDRELYEDSVSEGYPPEDMYDEVRDRHGIKFTYKLKDCIELYLDEFGSEQATHWFQQVKQVYRGIPYKNFDAPYPMKNNPIVLASILEKEAVKIRQKEAEHIHSKHEVDPKTLETKEIEPKSRH